MTYWRTAAMSVLAASVMTREDVNALLLFDTELLAPYIAHAHASVCPLTTISVHGRDMQKVQKQ
ncbi:MAG: 1-pyrroline-2-carboxylate reductase [NAD(P)H] [Paraglaciecola sp.]